MQKIGSKGSVNRFLKGRALKAPPHSMSIPWNPDPETVYNIIEFKSFSDLISIDFEVGTSQY